MNYDEFVRRGRSGRKDYKGRVLMMRAEVEDGDVLDGILYGTYEYKRCSYLKEPGRKQEKSPSNEEFENRRYDPIFRGTIVRKMVSIKECLLGE